MRNKTVLPKKYFSKYKAPLLPFPKLLDTQLNSFKGLLEKRIQNVITEFNPISDYSGKKLTMIELYKEHNVDTPYIKKNYKDVLKDLFDEGLIDAISDSGKPPKKGTFGDNILITFK